MEALLTMDGDTIGDAAAPPIEGEVAPPSPSLMVATAASATAVAASPKSKGATSKSDKASAYDKKFVENLTLLETIINDDGSLNYSSLNDAGEQRHMQNFVKVQRRAYRSRQNNEPTPMTEERYRLLVEAKFPFEPYNGTGKAKSPTDVTNKKKAASSTSTPHDNGASESPARTTVVQNVEKADPSPAKMATSTPQTTVDAGSDINADATSTDELTLTELKKSKSPKDDSKLPAKKSQKEASTSTLSPVSARKRSGKPTYLSMIHNAIVAMKERTGSSAPAISKWILANSQTVKGVHPQVIKTRLSSALKQGLKENRFAKVKGSYKISSDWLKKQREEAKAYEMAKKKAERQKELDKLKQQREEELAKKKAAEEAKTKEKAMTAEERLDAEEKQKRKEEAEARKKYIEQQLRKRRFPIEDTRLHKEDKEWGVKPPKRVIKRPALPHTLTCLVPPHLRSNIPKKVGSVATASTAGNGTLLGGNNDRGLITDAITVYHFFCGDVGLNNEEYQIPKFSLKTLFYALDEVLNGNAKAAKALPPLLTHLFLTALRMLTAPRPVVEDGSVETKDTAFEAVDLRLRKDLSLLREGLNAVSWSQLCLFYMDLMDRYYTSDVSLEDGVLPADGTLDMAYIWGKDSTVLEQNEPQSAEDIGDEKKLPDGYISYLGDPQSSLAKGYTKLQNQNEPWTLKADELMAMLRALTDDVLAKMPDLAKDIAGRGAKLNELSKAKRAAVVKLNKVKLAYEGPKKSTRQKKSDDTDDNGDNKDDEQAETELKEEEEKPFVPTATKNQFLAAEKAYNKAVEAYEAGLNKLISRTEPIGFDRNFNAIYFFRHDPTMLHIEQLKHSNLPTEIKLLGLELTPFSAWHAIDTKPLFEQFLESLDSRGQRENETLAICSSLTILKRRLQDERSDNTRAAAREREKEDLERRLLNAKNACDAEDGRRSGRLATMAVDELAKIEQEIKLMVKVHENEERQEKLGREKACDYSLLTGLQLVTDLLSGQRTTRSIRKSDKDDQTQAELLASVPSHKLWVDDKNGGNGTLGILVEALLSLEQKCNDLSPWDREDLTRGAWRKQLIDASDAWAIDCVMQLGPSVDLIEENDSLTSPVKKQKVELTSGVSVANLIATVKLCLKELEARIFVVSGKKRSLDEANAAADNEDNSSADGDDDELTKRHNCWKIKINALNRIPKHRYGLIRDVIIAAITVARKSHLNQVAAELKLALQLFRPHAGWEARSAAIRVLEKYGGYEGSDDDDDDFDELAAMDTGGPNSMDTDGAEISSLLCDELRMIYGSLGGDDFADTTDWNDTIKDCKSVSRFAAVLQIFLVKAGKVLDQLEEERNNLDAILGINAKRTSRTKSSIKNNDSSTHVWCNTKLSDKLVKARVSGYPWWPAHVCIPLDSVVANALEGSGYALISSVGNEGMFMVAEKDIIDFTEETDEDLSKFDKSTVDALHDSMAIAKTLWRQRNRGVASPWSKKSKSQLIVEEKKLD